MTLWVVLTLMTTLAAVGLIFPLLRRRDARDEARSRPADIAEGLEERIGDIDAEVEARSLPPEEADGLRAEARRRVLAEGAATPTAAGPLGQRALLAMGLGLAAVVALSATLLYSLIGRPDLAAAPSPRTPTAPAADNPHPDVAGMIAALEAKMRQSPGNLEGWRMLGWSYMRTGRYADAAQAYGRAAALDPANAELLSAEGEALTQAADGQVTPRAKALFAAALAGEPGDPRSRYFLAMARDQSGDHAGAMADWIALLRAAPRAAPWVGDVRATVIRIAAQHGKDITAELPPAPAEAAVAAPGPTADQAASTQALPADAQQAMIAGMVERLATRLKADPHDPDGWVRLMRARMVLGNPDRARSAYRDALAAYAGAPAQQAALRAAARDLGVPGA